MKWIKLSLIWRFLEKWGKFNILFYSQKTYSLKIKMTLLSILATIFGTIGGLANLRPCRNPIEII